MATSEVKHEAKYQRLSSEDIRKVLTKFRELIEAEEERLGWLGRLRRHIADIIRP